MVFAEQHLVLDDRSELVDAAKVFVGIEPGDARNLCCRRKINGENLCPGQGAAEEVYKHFILLWRHIVDVNRLPTYMGARRIMRNILAYKSHDCISYLSQQFACECLYTS